MATLADLRSAVESALSLPTAGTILQLNSNTRERAFEAYVFSLLVQAVRKAGGNATTVGMQTGLDPSTVVIRGGPGRLGSQSQDYAYAQCSLGSKEFELHIDVQYEGSSGAIHEVDVSIYDHDAAENVRLTPDAFANTRKLIGVLECKFYNSHLGTVLGRTFVGLVDDCGTLEFKAFATNGHSPGIASYLGHKKRPHGFFGLSPIYPDVEQRFVSWFEQELRQWAKVG